MDSVFVHNERSLFRRTKNSFTIKTILLKLRHNPAILFIKLMKKRNVWIKCQKKNESKWKSYKIHNQQLIFQQNPKTSLRLSFLSLLNHENTANIFQVTMNALIQITCYSSRYGHQEQVKHAKNQNIKKKTKNNSPQHNFNIILTFASNVYKGGFQSVVEFRWVPLSTPHLFYPPHIA